ncbi:hypothetical protein [[Eubacterium] hominis]|uniref:hypothetical protein n=1 Tax=[Eubacterium] hominis TaxID=2764325 RepID=UPI003A4D7E74
MVVYYIDDSFFQDSAFAKEMYERFLLRVERFEKGIILISSSHNYSKEIQQFKRNLSDGFAVLESPAVFDIDGIRGNLRGTYLALEDFDCMQTFSGSCIEYDTKKHQCERIYFDLFPEHLQLGELDLLKNFLENMLGKKVKSFKKKKEQIS